MCSCLSPLREAALKADRGDLKALKAGKGPLTTDEAMHKLVSQLDTKQIMWAVSSVTPEQKSLPVIEALDFITLVGTREDKTLKIKMTAKGSDETKVKEAADAVAKHAKDSAEFLSGIHMSIVLMAADLLKSVNVETQGTTFTLTARLQTTPAAILSLPMIYDADDVPAPRQRGRR